MTWHPEDPATWSPTVDASLLRVRYPGCWRRFVSTSTPVIRSLEVLGLKNVESSKLGETTTATATTTMTTTTTTTTTTRTRTKTTAATKPQQQIFEQMFHQHSAKVYVNLHPKKITRNPKIAMGPFSGSMFIFGGCIIYIYMYVYIYDITLNRIFSPKVAATFPWGEVLPLGHDGGQQHQRQALGLGENFSLGGA